MARCADYMDDERLYAPKGTALRKQTNITEPRLHAGGRRPRFRWDVGLVPIPAIAFWLFDSLADSAVQGGQPFWVELFRPEPSHLLVRALVSTLLVLGGLFLPRVFRQRRRARMELDNYTRTVEQIYRVTNVGVVILDENMVCVRVNDALTNIIGREGESFRGRPMREIAPAAAESIEPLVRVVFETKQSSVSIEIPWCQPDGPGQKVLWSVQCHPILMHDGSYAASCMIVDITAVRDAERGREQSESRFRDLADLIPQTVFEVDLAGAVQYTNRSGLQSFGYTEKEVDAGINMSSLFAEDDFPRLQADLQKKLSGEEILGREYMAKRIDGSLFPVRISASVVSVGGKPVGFRGVILDMSDLKSTEAALRDSEEQHRVTINALGDAIFVVDCDLRVVLYNAPLRRWNRRLGIKAGAIGKTVAELYPFLPDSVHDEYRHVIDTGETLITEEESLVGGALITTESRKIPVWEKGVVVRIITVIREITERKEAERELKRHRDHLEETVQVRTDKLARANEQLRKEIGDRRRAEREVLQLNENLEERVKGRTADLEKAYEDLKELDKMKDVFLSTISHEFRTPLTSIRSYSEVLLTYDDALETQRNFVQIINSESERLSRLIDNVLDLSQIEAGGMSWHDQPIQVEDAVRRVVRAETKSLEAKRVRISLDIENDTREVLVDIDRIHQVVANLIGNAIKFSPVAGEIIVRVEPFAGQRIDEPEDWVCVSVIDSGSGVADEDRDIIFERFRQSSSNTLTDKPKGVGLGLPICREIITHYEGNLWLENRPEGGSIFRFTLPCMTDEPADEAGTTRQETVEEELISGLLPRPPAGQMK